MTKHGRLIDADALKEILQAWKYVAQERGLEINNMFASAIIAQVDAMPTIEPERKTGEWIAIVAELGAHKTIVEGYNCSECGRYDAERDNFCPDCGARMEGK